MAADPAASSNAQVRQTAVGILTLDDINSDDASDRGMPVRLALSRRYPVTTIAFALLAFYALVVLIDARAKGNISTGDTDNLILGARHALRCVADGRFVNCDANGAPVYPYPLLQYIPASVFLAIGLGNAAVLKALAVVNFGAVVGIIVVAWRLFADRRHLGALLAASVVASTLPYHATAGFGEPLAALALLVAVGVSARRQDLVSAAAIAIACLGKETLAPFAVLLCLAAAPRPVRGWLPTARTTAVVIGGAFAGVAASALFNVFRFGTLRNDFYLNPALRTPNIRQQLRFFGALVVSPAGGVAWFWPLATVVILAGVVAGGRRLARGDRAGAVTAATAAITVGGFLAGLTMWFAPFGWIAFGPRLAVPILPAATYVIIAAYGDAWAEALRSRRTVSGLLGAIAAGAALPLVGAPWRWYPAIRSLITAPARCPDGLSLDIYGDPDTYFRCLDAQMWRLRPQLLDDTVVRQFSPAGLACLCAAIAVGLLVWRAAQPAARIDHVAVDAS